MIKSFSNGGEFNQSQHIGAIQMYS